MIDHTPDCPCPPLPTPSGAFIPGPWAQDPPIKRTAYEPEPNLVHGNVSQELPIDMGNPPADEVFTYLEPEETTSPSQDPEAFFHQKQACSDFRHSFWKQKRAAVERCLQQASIPAARRQRFSECGTSAWVLRSKQAPDKYRIRTNRCRDRFCDACSREKQSTICLNLRARLPAGTHRLVTFTLRSKPEPLTATIKRLYRSFALIRRKPVWSLNVTGGISFMEITRNPTTELFHVHLHVLVGGSFIPLKPLREEWKRITTDSFIIDVRHVGDGHSAAAYVAKYASKAISSTVWTVPEKLSEAMHSLAGRRTFNTFGTWTKLGLSKPPADDQEWEPVLPLWKLIDIAAQGDPWARAVLSSLSRRSADEPIDSDPEHPP